MNPGWQVYEVVEPARFPDTLTEPPCTIGGSGHQSTTDESVVY